MPVTVLHGHTTPETAEVVEDYPYGRILRCKIRYWVETGIKGAGKGRQRFVSQTTNPKAPEETWNKPKASQYGPLVIMYRNGNNHVRWYGFSSTYSMEPAQYHEVHAMGMPEQFTPEQRKMFDFMTKRAYTPAWDRWTEVRTYVEAFRTSHDRWPEYTNGQLEGLPNFYVGQQSDYLVMCWTIEGITDSDLTAHDTLMRDNPEYAARF